MQSRLLRACTSLLTAALTVAVLPTAHALTDVSSWAQTDVVAAASAGLMPDTFDALAAKAPVTRAEFCSIALRLYETARDTTLTRTHEVYFTDCANPDVNTAYEMKLISGRAGNTFDPNEPISRQDLCVVLDGVRMACEADRPAAAAPLSDFPDSSSLRPYASSAVETMLSAGVVKGVQASLSSDPEAEGRTVTVLAPQGTATREQALIMANRFLDAFEPAPLPVEEDLPDDLDESDRHILDLIDDVPMIHLPVGDTIPVAGDPSDKLTEVFGAEGIRYTDQAEAESHMTEITVPVWTLTASGEKVSSKRTITVHEALADRLTAVFEEIYEGEERFPIKNVGGYAWRASSRSEHRQGTAIDINWEENMECSIDADGNVTAITAGTHWTPGEDPYSIPAGGDVVRAFAKYGFSWGGDAWTSKRDYMHFSYFGT